MPVLGALSLPLQRTENQSRFTTGSAENRVHENSMCRSVRQHGRTGDVDGTEMPSRTPVLVGCCKTGCGNRHDRRIQATTSGSVQDLRSVAGTFANAVKDRDDPDPGTAVSTQPCFNCISSDHRDRAHRGSRGRARSAFFRSTMDSRAGLECKCPVVRVTAPERCPGRIHVGLLEQSEPELRAQDTPYSIIDGLRIDISALECIQQGDVVGPVCRRKIY